MKERKRVKAACTVREKGVRAVNDHHYSVEGGWDCSVFSVL